MKPSITNDDVYKAIIAFLKVATGYNTNNILRAYIDNVPLPAYPFVFVTVLKNTRSATNEKTFIDIVGTKTETISTSRILDVQLDFYGQDSIDEANVVESLFRDGYAVNYFQNSGIIPLYAEDIITPSARADENENFKVRNTMTLHFNLHPAVVVSQNFFDNIDLDVITITGGKEISNDSDSI